MHDHDRDRIAHPRPANPEPARRAEPARPVAPGRSPALTHGAILGLQRAAGNQGVVQMLAGEEDRSPVHDVVGKGGGSPLDASTRGTMESAFGRSFGDVRVHTDDNASKSAESVGANAYTVGSDVVFKSGQYNPATPEGQKTIAHELTHVVQQSQGPVAGTPASGGIAVSSPSDSFEQAAESNAASIMSSVQRQSEDEEEEAQQS